MKKGCGNDTVRFTQHTRSSSMLLLKILSVVVFSALTADHAEDNYYSNFIS